MPNFCFICTVPVKSKYVVEEVREGRKRDEKKSAVCVCRALYGRLACDRLTRDSSKTYLSEVALVAVEEIVKIEEVIVVCILYFHLQVVVLTIITLLK